MKSFRTNVLLIYFFLLQAKPVRLWCIMIHDSRIGTRVQLTNELNGSYFSLEFSIVRFYFDQLC